MDMANSWLDQIFGAEQISKGGLVRRSIKDVQAQCSLDDLLTEVRARKFHLIETGDQCIVICNDGIIKIHC